MSLFVRVLVMALAWLLLTLVSYYGCVRNTCCDTGAVTTTEAVVPPAAAEDDYGLVSRLGLGGVLAGSQWPALRDQIVSRYQADPNQYVDVYGYYYASEEIPDGYENMGFLRAAEIRDLLVEETDIPEDRIRLNSERREGTAPAGDELWRAAEFQYAAVDAGTGAEPESSVVELEESIVIRFPFDASTKRVQPNVADYLEKLAQRLQQTNERVTITGHTDNIDTDAYNLRLGQQRADFVRDILVRNGAPAGRITTRSEGESNPTATNGTAEGRAKNRRSVVRLQPE